MSSVSILPIAPVPIGNLKKSLERNGLSVVAEQGTISLVITRSYLAPGLENINKAAFLSQQPFLLCNPFKRKPWLGPLVVPGETACWNCLAFRLKNNGAEDNARDGRLRSSPLTFAPQARFDLTPFYDLLSNEIKLLLNGDSGMRDNMIVLSREDFEKKHHTVLRIPTCNVCGSTRIKGMSFELNALQTEVQGNNQSTRSISVDQTYENLSHHISPITGIIHQVEPFDADSDAKIRIYSTVYALPKRNDELLGPPILEVSSGKGRTGAESRTSAICEALERYSRAFQGNEARISSTYRELQEEAVHPATFLLYSNDQFHNRDAINKGTDDIREWIPERFDEALPISWSPCWSIVNKKKRYLPTAFCYDRFEGAGSGFCYTDSNGHAAGNTPAESILEGLLELIERDSIAMWWYNYAIVPGVDLSSFDIPFFSEIQSYYHALGYDFSVLDLTSDLNIPVFVAIARKHTSRRDPVNEDQVYFGFGVYPDVQIAIERAITELNQNLPWMLNRIKHVEGGTFGRGEQFFAGFEGGLDALFKPTKSYTASVYQSSLYTRYKDSRNKLIYCTNVLNAKGLDVLVLDQTRADVGLHVCKVVVPGLRHHWKRFAPGRLFDVPAKIGWVTEVKDEQDLNQFTFLF